jgi:anthranilate synthase
MNRIHLSVRYARWSLGFVNPPLEVSGTGRTCFIRALNSRGMVLLPAILKAMRQLHDDGVVQTVNTEQEGQVEVQVAPLSAVGSFSEEERSRQVNL